MSVLFEPVTLGELQLANRIVMAPMTRSRALADAVPGSDMVEYYRQRASAGLIVAEGTAPSASGLGYCRTPAIYSVEQMAGWQRVTDAVHAEGGSIVLQLMHVGRAASRHNTPQGAATVAPSALRARTQVFSDSHGLVDTDEPDALTLHAISQVINDYRQAARRAMAAGFDGIEIHAANGYLLDQFLKTGSNQRTDAYGGSIENRARLLMEVVKTVVDAIGGGRTGIRRGLGQQVRRKPELGGRSRR